MQTKIITDGNSAGRNNRIHFNEEVKINPFDNISPPKSITPNSKLNPGHSDQVKSKRVGIGGMVIGAVPLIMGVAFLSRPLLGIGLLIFIISDCIRSDPNFIVTRLFKKLFKCNESRQDPQAP